MVKTQPFRNDHGELCRAVYDPHKRKWHAHSLDRPFHVTQSFAALSSALFAGQRAEWLSMLELSEAIR